MKRIRFRYVEAAVVAVVLVAIGAVTVTLFVQRQTRDVERRIHHDIAVIINAIQNASEGEKLQSDVIALLDSMLPDIGNQTIVTTGVESRRNQYSAPGTARLWRVSPLGLRRGGRACIFDYKTWKHRVEAYTSQEIEEPTLFFRDEYANHPFMVELLNVDNHSHFLPTEFGHVVAIFVPWPDPTDEETLTPTEVVRHVNYFSSGMKRFRFTGALKHRGFFYNPSNGLNSSGYVYYDSLGNSSYER